MKMKTEHLDTLRKLVNDVDTAERRSRYASGDFPNASAVKDLDKRYRWDLFYATPQDVRGELVSELYQYLNDAHIDTALKSIVPNIG